MHVYDGHGSSSELACLTSLHSSPLTFIEVTSTSAGEGSAYFVSYSSSTTVSMRQWCQETKLGCWNTGVDLPLAIPSPKMCSSSISWTLTSMNLSRCISLYTCPARDCLVLFTAQSDSSLYFLLPKWKDVCSDC